MTPSKFFIAMAFLTELGRADVLIGREPCLWKRPITQTRDNLVYREVDYKTFISASMDNVDQQMSCAGGGGYEDCHYKIGEQVIDTTGWETYWDACPVVHGGTAIDLGGK